LCRGSSSTIIAGIVPTEVGGVWRDGGCRGGTEEEGCVSSVLTKSKEGMQYNEFTKPTVGKQIILSNQINKPTIGNQG